MKFLKNLYGTFGKILLLIATFSNQIVLTVLRMKICRKNFLKILNIFWESVMGIYRKVYEDFREILEKIHENMKITEEMFGRFFRNKY